MVGYAETKIVPDVIPTAPSGLIKVSYPNSLSVDFGKELTPTQVKDKPTLSWATEPDALYTLIMTDPDVPETVKPEFKHWLVINIPGTDIAKGTALNGYISSGPGEGSGIHRYLFLVYKQAGGSAIALEVKERDGKEEIADRRNFVTQKFAETHNLGTPIAGNYYLAQHDDYVPVLYKKFADGTAVQ